MVKFYFGGDFSNFSGSFLFKKIKEPLIHRSNLTDIILIEKTLYSITTVNSITSVIKSIMVCPNALSVTLFLWF